MPRILLLFAILYGLFVLTRRLALGVLRRSIQGGTSGRNSSANEDGKKGAQQQKAATATAGKKRRFERGTVDGELVRRK